MIKHRYNNKDYNSQYVTYSGGDFIYSSFDEFPVMLIAEASADDGWAYADMHISTVYSCSPCRGLRQTSWQTEGLLGRVKFIGRRQITYGRVTTYAKVQ